VLDVGCGAGGDAVAIAALVAPGGRVVGVDTSRTMVEEARRRAAGRALPVEFRVARAEHLDAPDGSFDACRFERVLQHLADPATALHEAARILRPGGQVAAFEPDWLGLEITGGDPEVTRRVLGRMLGTIPSPGVGARLPQLLSEAGFEEVRSLELRLSGSHSVALRSLRMGVHSSAAAAAGVITEAESAAWLHHLDGAAASGILGVRASLHLSAGTRPAALRQPAATGPG
jgi:SAM-dependent methyltransferase